MNNLGSNNLNGSYLKITTNRIVNLATIIFFLLMIILSHHNINAQEADITLLGFPDENVTSGTRYTLFVNVRNTATTSADHISLQLSFDNFNGTIETTEAQLDESEFSKTESTCDTTCNLKLNSFNEDASHSLQFNASIDENLQGGEIKLRAEVNVFDVDDKVIDTTDISKSRSIVSNNISGTDLHKRGKALLNKRLDIVKEAIDVYTHYICLWHSCEKIDDSKTGFRNGTRRFAGELTKELILLPRLFRPYQLTQALQH